MRKRSRKLDRHKLQLTCAANCPVAYGALQTIQYAKENDIDIYIATAESSRYAKSRTQKRFLKSIGLENCLKNKLFTIPEDYQKNGKTKSLKSILSELQKKGIKAGDVVFFDDLRKHVYTARKLGMHSFTTKKKMFQNTPVSYGITPSILTKVKLLNPPPKVFIFDIDGTLTNNVIYTEASIIRNM